MRITKTTGSLKAITSDVTVMRKLLRLRSSYFLGAGAGDQGRRRLDADHGIFGGTLPSDRSPLRGNRFREPRAYRQDREPAEAAHALAGEGGLRQAAKRLGIHRYALKAAFGQWGLPALERRGWQPSRFLTERAEAERAFALAERLGSVNAAAAELGTT